MNKVIAQSILAVSCVFFCGSVLIAKPQKPSGIYGWALFKDNTPLPDIPSAYYLSNCEVVITDAGTGKVVKRGHSNNSGKFKITMPPGKYIVFPIHKDYTDSITTDKTEVTVWQGFYSKADASFNNGW